MQPTHAHSVFSRTWPLPAGPRVRLRLARQGDHDAVRALLAGRGVAADDFDIRRLLTFDPANRLVLCATAPLDGRETLVGIGAIDLGAGADIDTLVVDERLTQGLGDLLGTVLLERAAVRARRVA